VSDCKCAKCIEMRARHRDRRTIARLKYTLWNVCKDRDRANLQFDIMAERVNDITIGCRAQRAVAEANDTLLQTAGKTCAVLRARATAAEAALAEAREGYMMLPEDLEVQRLRAEVKRQTVNVTALCDDNERLAGERDQARRDAVALWNPHARFENPLELRDRIVAYRAALRDTDK